MFIQQDHPEMKWDYQWVDLNGEQVTTLDELIQTIVKELSMLQQSVENLVESNQISKPQSLLMEQLTEFVAELQVEDSEQGDDEPTCSTSTANDDKAPVEKVRVLEFPDILTDLFN